MTLRFLRSVALLFLTAPSIFAQFQAATPSLQKERHHTQVQLIADVKAINPGDPFTVGILMTMDKGWHTYWKNAGEAGLPTQVRWQLPEGFTAGPIEWPAPHKYSESGDILTYGYEDETMLLATLYPPAGLNARQSLIKADVNWLECEKLCVPGSASVSLTLPVSSGPSVPDHQQKFTQYRSLIPKPLQGDLFDVSYTATNGTVEIRLKGKAGENVEVSDFYPGPVGDVVFGRTQVRTTSSGTVLRFTLGSFDKQAVPDTLGGVVVYDVKGVRRFGTVQIPLTAEFLSSLPDEPRAESQESTSLLDADFSVESAAASQPLYVYVFFAIIGGLLLNIMPCVLPVIALKIFGLVKMAGDEPRQVRKLGVFFSLGILASFLALALLVILLKSAGESVGWGFQFQEPLFIIIMATIVFAFGLSLFGVFEITVPGFALSGANALVSQTEGKKGFLAPFSEGVFATILATPCTAPILGTALGFAFAQPWYATLLIFASTAFGMALPYLLLTAKPKWMKFLPKPGQWMETAKQFMGFLMMATLVWLLRILGSQLGMEAVVWTLAFLLFVGVASWVIGRFATLSATKGKYAAAWGMALVLVVAGYQLFVADVLKARDLLSDTDSPNTVATDAEGIPWEPFSLPQLETYLNEHRTVFIDFTAEWCLTCKVNEKTVLADRSVIDELKRKNIVTMKADWTNKNETITKLLAKFGRSGVPLYVIFPSGKPTEPIILPEVITTGIVLEALEKAG